MRKTKIGILGGGTDSAIGAAHHFALKNLPGLEIISVLHSRDTAKAKMSAEFYGIDKNLVAEDIHDFFNKCAAHSAVVVILTPSDSHFHHIKCAFDLGLKVIVEKPACVSVKEAQVLSAFRPELLDGSFVIHNYCHYPMLQLCAQEISVNKLGGVRYLRLEFAGNNYRNLKYRNLQPQNWRLNDGLIPMIFHDLGSHLLAIIQALVGRTCHDSKKMWAHFTESPEFNVVGECRFWELRSDGMIVDALMSKERYGFDNGMSVEVQCETGAYFWRQETPDELVVVDNGGRKILTRSNLCSDLARTCIFKPGHPTGFVESIYRNYSSIFETGACRRLPSSFGGDFTLRDALSWIDYMNVVASVANYKNGQAYD